MYTMKDSKVIEAICDLYKEGATIREVSTAAGVGESIVSEILKERGLTRPRGCRPGSRIARGDKEIQLCGRTCPTCGSTKHLPEAMFCCICGASLATKRELAAEACGRLLKFLEPYKATQNMERVIGDANIIRDYFEEA